MEVRHILPYICFLCVGIFWAQWALLANIVRFLLNPSKGWGYRVRKERPLCLKATDVWTHHLVTLQHDGIKVHYVSAGSLDKPLMVLLHGFPEIWYSWRHQIQHFMEDYRVVALSMRGYGDSDSPAGVENYKSDKLVADVDGLVKSLGYDTCVLVGHDWGGGVAWTVALNHPGLVSRLIILNCPNGAAFKELIQSSFKQFRMSWYMFFFQLPWLPEYMITRMDLAAITWLLESFCTDKEIIEAYLYFFSQPGALTGPINYYRAAYRYPRLPKPTFSMPVLIVWGTDDLCLHEDLATMSAAYCTNVTVKKIPGGNHFIQQDKPDEVNNYMREFLQN